MKFEKSYGAVVFRQINDTLCVLMINFEYSGMNVWGFPKGHSEKGETAIQTACRETKEETFIDIEITHKFKQTVKFSLTDNNSIRNRIVTYFVGEPLSTNIKAESNKLTGAEWIRIDKAKELITFECDRIILEKAYRYFIASTHYI